MSRTLCGNVEGDSLSSVAICSSIFAGQHKTSCSAPAGAELEKETTEDTAHEMTSLVAQLNFAASKTLATGSLSRW